MPNRIPAVPAHVHAPHEAHDAAQPPSLTPVTRRDFLGGVGVSVAVAAAALTGCTRAPDRKIVPYRVQPEDMIPGRAAHYATAMSQDGYAVGLLVEAHEGRPTKIEGNPSHPASLGAAGAREQAAIIELYGARRAQRTLRTGAATSRAALASALQNIGPSTSRGARVDLVMPPQSSPLAARLITEMRGRLPELRVHYHTALSRSRVFRGTALAFGEPLEVRADLRRATIILALDADFLTLGPSYLAMARAFADGRRVGGSDHEMSRLYVVEATQSLTGQIADHRLALRDAELPAFTLGLVAEIARLVGQGVPAEALQQLAAFKPHAVTPERARFASALARDLVRQRAEALVLVGDRQPASVHAAAHAINRLLSEADSCVKYAASPLLDAGGSAHDSLAELSQALAAGEVDNLVVLGTDLCATSAPELQLKHRLTAAKQSFYFGLFEDDTAAACQWFAPAAHWLEGWDEVRAQDGTLSVAQPLLMPLYAGFTGHEVLALVGRSGPQRAGHELVREAWQRERPANFEAEWERLLARGTVDGTGIDPSPSPKLSWGWLAELIAVVERTRPATPALELSIAPDPRLLDGRFAENPWLAELPDAVTKLCWTNAATLSERTAHDLGVASGQVVTLSASGRRLEVPALIERGQADGSVGLTLGWGGRQPSLTSEGADAFRLTSTAEPWTTAVSLTALTRRVELPITQRALDGDGLESSIVAVLSLADYQANPALLAPRRRRQLSLFGPSDAPRAERQWGMSIDLSACTGCSACVVACQAENNIPSVGRIGVLKGRQMHWIRVDRYVVKEKVVLQPMACQHCENAPCEYVCPTGATAHSSDGLNQMVYNRCVGTRFCSNNCPYKVRRFNWLDYHATDVAPHEFVYNPNVSVRERGVMEKCSYCVQRIRSVEIDARVGGAPIVDGKIVTACEQACPSGAIVFGDLADPASRVAKLRSDGRGFDVLGELGTAPRTRYLARLTNPNPELT